MWELPLEFAGTAINYVCAAVNKTNLGSYRFLKFVSLLLCNGRLNTLFKHKKMDPMENSQDS